MSSTSCPLWSYDDITNCTRNYVLNGIYPVLFGGTSFIILTTKSAVYLYKHRKGNHSNTGESEPLLAATDAYGSTEGPSAEPISIKERHFDLRRLPDTNDDGTPHGKSELVYKDTADRIRVCLEYIIVILSLALELSTFFVHDLHHAFKHYQYVPVIKSLLWAYIFIIVTIRVCNLNKVHFYLPSLWTHSTTLYFFNFFPTIISFRSALINTVKGGDQVRLYYILEFAFATLLVLLNFSSKTGDKPSVLYRTSNGVTPSPENISSLFQFISYSWLDPMVWKAKKQPLTMKDIWGLREDDYALAILKSFETSKKAVSFTWKLFSHFKWLLAVQMFWATLEAFLIFVPSILLKKILEYVESPETQSANLAWCFIIAMPAFKMLDSLSAGCSLFIGRRVCLRMKSIIIGEVYAKALRRKITVSEAETSDEKEEPATKGTEDNVETKSTSSKETKKTAELGAIINLMAIDAFKVSEICGYLHFFVGSILMILICIYLLYGLLGWSALVGAFSIVVLLPLNYKVASYIGTLQKEMLEVTDKRIQKLNETFQSIRIIKFFSWEDKFYDSILEVRAKEIYVLSLRTACWCAGSFIWFVTPTLITFLSFYCFTIVEGKTLTPPIAFTALSLFSLLRSPLDQLSDMTAIVIQSKVSLDRVDDFLNEDESTKYDQLSHSTPSSPDSPYIGFEKASFSWNSKAEKNDFKLRDINIDFKAGKLNVVIGATGSGKTSLLLALLGEMDLTAGQVFLPGIIPRDELIVDPRTGLTESVAYCSQAAWLLNDTIRNNIVFAASFNEERYQKVVTACGLQRDFEILSAGDATEIGEKGITLSGGQKQRVSLARALYSNSKHVLLDDCLSAVDSHTALWIYENCISGPLMQGRTCILVSHNVALTVQNAEWVIVMDNGRVKIQGTPEELLSSGDLGDDDLVKSSVINSRNQSTTNLQSLNDKNADLKAKTEVIEGKLKAAAAASLANEGGEHLVTINDEIEVKQDGKLVEEEAKSDGVVAFKVYADYAKVFGGWPTWFGIIATFAVCQAIYMSQSFWLRKWSMNNGVEIKNITETSMMVNQIGAVYNGAEITSIAQPVLRVFQGGYNMFLSIFTRATSVSEFISVMDSEQKSTMYYISIYGAIGIVYSVLACIRVFVTFFAGVRASNRIFKAVLDTVLRAKLRFFDKTPQGRIMNRFSKDIEAVDQELTPFAEGVFACVVTCVSTLFLITIITPGFLFFAIIIAFLYYLVGIFYVSASRELKRFESITKSPIHQHFSESLNGVATIRAYGVESRFMKQNLQSIDDNNRPFFYLWVANRWLSFRVDAVGSLVMLFAAIFVMMSIGKIDAGLAGLSLSYAIAFSESALWIVRLYANVEMNMNSVERLQEYLDIEQEPAYDIPETAPQASWPERGEISVKGVSLRYAPELPRVIKNVSFDVESCHKIGIVGRTGAGKSTIITAFFRFIDPETGSITIDGVDITKIGLRNLRQAITIIPQDPTLFTGTIRSNLDPFDQYSDSQIFEALRRVNLIGSEESISSAAEAAEVASNGSGENQNKFLNLQSAVTEGGGNLSQGQRQLMCLGRSLLKSPKVILLDEATASIDYKSDAMIQQTIRDEFSGSTILTIAHRLRSIIDYDKILVMDAGTVVEYEDPYKLIANTDSLFYSMCENSGELESLTKLAKESFIQKKNKQKK
ncbi:ATP-dependent bile acid permease [[Candida] railenensis]|uniref:ATP-dependent bile acid permease n=1 Tax=[Candida] railenensis TaxID=45579 RepID=A0A9P0QUK1_9ASCO|nr:ATP-dependent bile acid permease [[Candida] railenensis]